jgi:hypothetical protein
MVSFGCRISVLWILVGLVGAISDLQEVIATDGVVGEEGGSFTGSYSGSYSDYYSEDDYDELSPSAPEDTYVSPGATETAEDVISGVVSSVRFDLGVRQALMEGTSLIMTVQAFNQRKQEYLAEAISATLAVDPETIVLAFSTADSTDSQHINNRWESASGVLVDVYVTADGDIEAVKSKLEGLVEMLKGESFLTDFSRTLGLIQSIGGDIAKIDSDSLAYSPRSVSIMGNEMMDYAIAKMSEEARLGTDENDEDEGEQLLLGAINANLPPTLSPTLTPLVELTYNITTVPGVSFEEKEANIRKFKGDVNSILEEFIDKEYGVDKGMRPERIHADITDLSPPVEGYGSYGDGDGPRDGYYRDPGYGEQKPRFLALLPLSSLSPTA